MKKILSLVLALCMVLMVGAAFAVDNSLTADSTLSISGLEEGDTAKFYQVLKFSDSATATGGWVNAEGFSLSEDTIQKILGLGEYATGKSKANLAGISSTTAGEIAIDAKDATVKYSPVANDSGVASVTQGVVPGLYVIIVTPADPTVMYNPVFVGADYKTNESNTWAVNMRDTYADQARAKKSDVTIEKTASDYTHNHDAIVKFTVTTTIPEFAENYTKPMFKVNDKLSAGLEIQVTEECPFTVTPSNAVYTGKPATGDKEFHLVFDETYLKGLEDKTTVTIEYYAKVTNAAPYNVNPDTNDVTVQFSNNPDNQNDYGLLKDHTNHYTFSLDASILGNTGHGGSEVVKSGRNPDGTIKTDTITYDNEYTTSPLAGAHFILSNDPEGKDPYKNNLINGEDIVSLGNGKFEIKGLDAGTYYLTETSAPAGYVKSSSVYKIEIIPNEKTDLEVKNEVDSSTGKNVTVTYTTNILLSYEVKITELKADGTTVSLGDSTFTMTNDGPITMKSSTTDVSSDIPNTEGVELPSTGGIGTTIFYILGGLLVIGAAVILVARRKAQD